MRRTLFGALLVALLLVDVGSSPASVRKVDRCSADGGFACEVSGTVRHPRRIFIEVGSRPRHSYAVDWTTVCSKWSRHRRRSDTSTGTERTPFKEWIGMAFWRPRECRVEASAFGGFDCCGHTKLLLLARVARMRPTEGLRREGA